MQSELPPSTDSTPSEPSAPVEPKGVWAGFSRAQKIVASIGLATLLCPLVGFVIVISVWGVKDWQAFGDAITRLSIFTLVIIGIFYAVAKAKSRSAAWASVITLLTLSTCFSGLALTGFAMAWRSGNRAKAADKSQEALRQIADRVERANNSNELDPALTRKNADLAATELNKAFTADSPQDQAAIRAATDYIKVVAESYATYEESLKPFAKAGGLDPRTMTNPGDARQRRNMLDGPRSRFQFVKTTWKNFASSVEATMRKEGASEEFVLGFVNGLTKSPNQSLQVENLSIEEQLLQNMDTYLSILEKHDGNWRVNEAGKVIFGQDVPDQDIDKLNRSVDEREDLTKRQAAIQAEVLQNMRNRSTQRSR